MNHDLENSMTISACDEYERQNDPAYNRRRKPRVQKALNEDGHPFLDIAFDDEPESITSIFDADQRTKPSYLDMVGIKK